MLLKLLLSVQPSPWTTDAWGPFSSGLKVLLMEWWSAGQCTASHVCQGGVWGREASCIGVVLTYHRHTTMVNHERGHYKALVGQLRKNAKIQPFSMFSSLSACPNLPCPTESWHASHSSKCTPKIPHSWQVWLKNRCVTIGNPHDITISVSGYPAFSVITPMTGERSASSAKKVKFLMAQAKTIKFYSL